MFKTYDEFLVNLVKRLDKNKNGFIEFEELTDGLNELLLLMLPFRLFFIRLGFNLTY